MEFTPYPKTPRLNREITITEKIDGTNAQVVILDSQDPRLLTTDSPMPLSNGHGLSMLVGSRTRWITPGKATDNFGFAQWCADNAEGLFGLGLGQHFGEWYGRGIQRGYGLDHKRFALFNTHRWTDNPQVPECCEVVPVLYRGSLDRVGAALEALLTGGSTAVPGYMNPEGINVYHSAAKSNFKVLLERDDVPKGYTAEELDRDNPYTQHITAP